MRFSVTPLGSPGGRSVTTVVSDIAKYLLGWPGQRDAGNTGREGPWAQQAGMPESAAGPSRYYADAGEGPGRWLGRGATELGMAGIVEQDAFESVLAGRHPVTGERLITARGTAGRVAELGAGTAARFAEDDSEAMYGIADVATVLRWSRDDVSAAIEEGASLAAERLFAVLAGAPTVEREAGLAIVPTIELDGTVLVRERELARVEAQVDTPRDGTGVLVDGDPDDLLTPAEAAALVGASPSYVARLCRRWEQDRAKIEKALAEGKPTGTAWLVAHKEAGTWRIRREDLAAYAERRRRPSVRVGYDLTLTTEKSLSVLALLGGPDARAEVFAAIEAANDTGLDWLERNAACARAGGEVVGVTGWTAASFRHLTSRRLDPFIHHHNVVANTVTDEHGVRRALDARRLYHSARAASAIATAQARYEMVSRLGVAFRPARHGGWEIAGIDDAVVREFSTRTREVMDTVRELERYLGRSSTMEEFRGLVLSTRPAKRSGEDATGLLAQWWERARAHGLTPDSLAGCLGRRGVTVLDDRRRGAILDALTRAVTAESSVFDRTDVLAALVDLPDPDGEDLGPVIVPAAVLEDLADEFLTSDRVVALAGSTGRRDRLTRRDGGGRFAVGDARVREYSTREILTVQARALERYEQGFEAGRGVVPAEVLAAVIEQCDSEDPAKVLAGEQRRVVEEFCTSGDVAQSAIGRAGTGKTFAMRVAVRAWEAAGYRVLGTAVKSEAARHLGDECGIPAEPLAWYLRRLDDPERLPFDAKTVLLVDEASTVGDRDLDKLLGAVLGSGAVLRLIGDPAQHSSVAAGGLWGAITRLHARRTPEIKTIRRVRNDDDRFAAEQLRQGDARTALATLEAAGHLHIAEDERDLYVQMLSRWWEARQAGKKHPMVDQRNDQRVILNRLAQALRRQQGELGDVEITATGDRRFAKGDEVVARMTDRNIHPPSAPQAYIRNGAHGVVTAVETNGDPAEDQLVVDFPDLGTITLPRSYFDEHADPWGGKIDVGLDHAYAVTSYTAIGQTFPKSTSHIDPKSTRPEVYVDLTRGIEDNHAFVTRADSHLDGERLPEVPPDDIVRQLEERLSGPPGEPVALELDRAAAAAALAHHRGGHQADAMARQLVRRAVTHPDPTVVACLGMPPDEVYLAKTYRRLLAEIAVYRTQRQPRMVSNGVPWGWALGLPPTDGAGRADHDMLARRIGDFAVAVARRRLGRDLGPSAVAIVDRLASDGLFGQIDFERAAECVRAGRTVEEAIVRGAEAGTAPKEAIGVA